MYSYISRHGLTLVRFTEDVPDEHGPREFLINIESIQAVSVDATTSFPRIRVYLTGAELLMRMSMESFQARLREVIEKKASR